MAAIGGATTALANAPKEAESIVKIIRWVGEDKEKEEEERLRLVPPPKALPDLSKNPQISRRQPAFDSDLDDDVPF